MGYRLKHDEPLEREVRRLAIKQLQLAIDDLRRASGHGTATTIHSARRHVKKVRAINRLMQGALGSRYSATNHALREAGRMLAPISDSEAVVATLRRLRRTFRNEFPPETYSSIRAILLRRKRRAAQKARSERVLQNVVRLLRAEQEAVPGWRLKTHGFRAVASGLRRSYRRARRAMRLADCPTTDNYHSWRRRVKDHWFEVRLLEERCGGQLQTDEKRLELLDGYLGEFHNCVVLQHAVMTDTLDSRMETARFLRLLRRYQRDLRRESLAIGAQLYRETPRQFVRRVRQLWRAGNRHRPVEAPASRALAA